MHDVTQHNIQQHITPVMCCSALRAISAILVGAAGAYQWTSMKHRTKLKADLDILKLYAVTRDSTHYRNLQRRIEYRMARAYPSLEKDRQTDSDGSDLLLGVIFALFTAALLLYARSRADSGWWFYGTAAVLGSQAASPSTKASNVRSSTSFVRHSRHRMKSPNRVLKTARGLPRHLPLVTTSNMGKGTSYRDVTRHPSRTTGCRRIGFQRPLVPRFRFQPRLSRSVRLSRPVVLSTGGGCSGGSSRAVKCDSYIKQNPSNNSSPLVILTMTPLGYTVSWSKEGCIVQMSMALLP